MLCMVSCTNVEGWLREFVVRRRTHNLFDFVAGKETKTREGERKSGMSFEENRRTRSNGSQKYRQETDSCGEETISDKVRSSRSSLQWRE